VEHRLSNSQADNQPPKSLKRGQNNLGAALMKQVKTATNKGVQHYQHWLYATFWQDNPVAEGYLG